MHSVSPLLEPKELIHPYRPVFFRLKNNDDREQLTELLRKIPAIERFDAIDDQLKDLMKCRHPSLKLSPTDLTALIHQHLNGCSQSEYGVWIYYPWSKRLVHALDKDEFIEVRTSRNLYKITPEEQQRLATKKIGVIGLSVGQSVAMTLVLERVLTEIRLADFDVLDLSNLNRLRTGIHYIGEKKVYITAREIAEIDPYITVKCFEEGITESNLDDFILEDGKLDLLIEECDSLDVKVLARYKAREHRVPVLMETSDRGLLDVERYDLEPNRPILHNLIDDINPQQIKDLTTVEKLPVLLQMIDSEQISMRAKVSLFEIEQSIATWPQLASSVVLGGAVVTDVTRRLLLGHFNESGRYYVDLEELIPAKETKPTEKPTRTNPYLSLTAEEMELSIGLLEKGPGESSFALTSKQLHSIIRAGIAAPSTGNDQPWKWFYKAGILYLFHDRHRSFSFGDCNNMASHLTFGAVIENVRLQTRKLGLDVAYDLFPFNEKHPLVAKFHFSPERRASTVPDPHPELVDFIFDRCTNRNLSVRQEIDPNILQNLKAAAETIEGAELKWIADPEQIRRVGAIIGACDRIRFLNEEGHADFVNREMRWPGQENQSQDGISVLSLGLDRAQVTALNIIKDYRVIHQLKEVKGGKFFEAATAKTIRAASVLGLITMPKASAEQYINGGRSFQRMWLTATRHKLALHPLISPVYLFYRLVQGNGEGLSEAEKSELQRLRKSFKDELGTPDETAEVFLFKLAYAEPPALRSARIPVEEVLYY